MLSMSNYYHARANNFLCKMAGVQLRTLGNANQQSMYILYIHILYLYTYQ